MEEGTNSEQVTDEAFRKCERRGRRGACAEVELPSEKLEKMLQNLKITEKEDESSKDIGQKEQET